MKNDEDKINKYLFDKSTKYLLEVLNKANIDEKEKNYRKEKLLSIYEEMLEENYINNEYYSLAHEIKSFELFSKFTSVILAKDYKHEAGCDIRIYNNYQIECVTSSPGDENKNGYNAFYGSGIFDYNKKETIILTRILQSLNEKKVFYYNHLNKTIKENDPYIIFVSIGSLSYGSLWGELGVYFNKALLGLDHEVIHFDREQQKFTERSYEYRDYLINHNNAPVNCKFFCEENSFVSAVIFSNAALDSEYSKENTFVFINPFAKNKVQVNKLPGLVYWKADKYNKYYIPRYKGKNINEKIKHKYF